MKYIYICILALAPLTMHAAPTFTSNYWTPGNHSFTTPVNTTDLNIRVVGGGGGGAYILRTDSDGNEYFYYGAGAGSGANLVSNFRTAPGWTYPILIGAGGSSADATSPCGYNGSYSYVANALIANGGSGGGRSGIDCYNDIDYPKRFPFGYYGGSGGYPFGVDGTDAIYYEEDGTWINAPGIGGDNGSGYGRGGDGVNAPNTGINNGQDGFATISSSPNQAIYTSNSADFPAGYWNFTVPANVYSITAQVVGGGGGGGGSYHDGDTWVGGGGGSGAYTTQTIAVTPGQQFLIKVGIGGCAGHFWYAGLDYGGSCATPLAFWAFWSGGNGGNSTIDDPWGTNFVTANGGFGGINNAHGWYFTEYNSGQGGAPNGVPGTSAMFNLIDCTSINPGGDNGTGYGSGGNGGGCRAGDGGHGRVYLTWTTSTGPVAITQGATPSADSAVINGSGNPKGFSTGGYLTWGTTNTGSCATLPNWTPYTDLGSGNSWVDYNASIVGLSPNTTYYYCALVSNIVNVGYGEILSFTTLLSSVTNLVATPGACGTGSINLTWDPVPGAVSYELRDNGVYVLTAASNFANLTGLIQGSVHNYSVRGINATTFSEWSAEVAVNAPSDSCVVNGVCGIIQDSCTVGTPAAYTGLVDSNFFQWNCDGTGGGTSVECSLPKPPTNGICGASANTCSMGNFGPFTGISDSNYYQWDCYGLAGGSDSECSLLKPTNALTVLKAGAGVGTVSSAPAGIACGADCTNDYSEGTSVVLTAAPSGGSAFAGWSGGGCSGTGTCTVTMDADMTVTATFDVSTWTFTTNATLKGTPRIVDPGKQATLTYNTYGQDCTLTGVGPVNTVVDTPVPTAPLYAQTKFVLTCAIGASPSVTIEVYPLTYET